MTLEEVRAKLQELYDQQCDCVLSICAGSQCGRCKDIRFYKQLEDLLLKNE